ncbi:MAG TPA: NUDIX domain-containing protein [Stellaceae bacterium]|nr:NUDIX domain-containing protein [Stellaceae bacterium]
MNDAGVDIINRETVYRGFFRVDKFRLRHRLYAGGWTTPMEREIFERGRAVGVLLYDPAADAVVLVEQFRLAPHLVGLPAWQAEIVAGIVSPGDDADEAVARREAREEAGIIDLGALLPIHRFMPSSGGSSELVSLYCGHVDSARAGGHHGLPEEHEDTKVLVLRYRAAMQRMRSGAITNAATIIALYWLAANRVRLKREWREHAATVKVEPRE